jgi:hypothetical protein
MANDFETWWNQIGKRMKTDEHCIAHAAYIAGLMRMSGSPMQRFTAYRRNLSERGTHDAFQGNADHEPQFEGVVFSDGRVAIRWLTRAGSTSIWDRLTDMLRIHGHPEYGTVIHWHDGPTPQVWQDMVDEHAAKVAAQRAMESQWSPPIVPLRHVDSTISGPHFVPDTPATLEGSCLGKVFNRREPGA